MRSCKREVCGLFDHLVTCSIFMLRSLLCRGLDWWEFGTPVLCRPFVISFADLVKILHGGGGGGVERWLEPRNKFLVFAISFLIAFYCFTFLSCDISCLNLIALISFTCLFRSLLILTRKQLRPSTHNLEESKRRSSRALHGKFGFNFLF